MWVGGAICVLSMAALMGMEGIEHYANYEVIVSNESYLRTTLFPLFAIVVIEVMVVESITRLFNWSGEWLPLLSITMWLYFVEGIYKFKPKGFRDIFWTALAVLLPVVIIIWAIQFPYYVALLVQTVLYFLVCISLWVIPYLFGSEELRNFLKDVFNFR